MVLHSDVNIYLKKCNGSRSNLKFCYCQLGSPRRVTTMCADANITDVLVYPRTQKRSHNILAKKLKKILSDPVNFVFKICAISTSSTLKSSIMLLPSDVSVYWALS